MGNSLFTEGSRWPWNLETQNVCLLSKWIYKVINEDGVWQELLRKKYLKNKTISEVKWKPGDSHFLVRPYEGQRSLPSSIHF